MPLVFGRSAGREHVNARLNVGIIPVNVIAPCITLINRCDRADAGADMIRAAAFVEASRISDASANLRAVIHHPLQSSVCSDGLGDSTSLRFAGRFHAATMFDEALGAREAENEPALRVIARNVLTVVIGHVTPV